MEEEKMTSGQEQPAEKESPRFEEYDREVFRNKYPDIDLESLLRNESFLRFCGNRLWKMPLVRLYEDYTALLEEAGETERKKHSQEDKARRSTASGSHSGGDGLTAAEQKALDEWNKAFPQLKMTAKEFLSRKD